MEDKTQYEALAEELQKIVENFKVGFTEIGEILSKLLPDEEEDTWEMKCPYECGGNHYFLQSSGDVFSGSWDGIEADNKYFSQGNIFLTEEAAELESKRRNLLTRFKAFRDECNGDWKPESEKVKYYICLQYANLSLRVSSSMFWDAFNMFGYFKNEEDTQRAIELFGDEIKRLYVEVE